MSYPYFEQRKARRYDMRLPLELVRFGKIEASGRGETRNVSSKGVLFRSDARFQIGESIEYLITLPFGSHDDQPRISCLGRVVRCSPRAEVAVTLERYEFVRATADRRTIAINFA